MLAGHPDALVRWLYDFLSFNWWSETMFSEIFQKHFIKLEENKLVCNLLRDIWKHS